MLNIVYLLVILTAPRAFARTPDPLAELMKMVLARDSRSWEPGYYDYYQNTLGAEPTFVPVDEERRSGFRKGGPKSINDEQIDEMDRINAFYEHEYPKTAAARDFPCRVLKAITYVRPQLDPDDIDPRVKKFAKLNGRRIVAFQCHDRISGQEFRFMQMPDAGVIEFFIQPDILAGMIAKRRLMQAVIFDVMKELRYRPDAFHGLGHLHFAWSFFANDYHAHTFFRFIYENAYLFEGVWIRDYANASGLNEALFHPEHQDEVLPVLRGTLPWQKHHIRHHFMNRGGPTALIYSFEFFTVEWRGNRAFESAAHMVNQMVILNYWIKLARRLPYRKYRRPQTLTWEQALRRYFAKTIPAVGRECARALLLDREQPTEMYNRVFSPELPNLRKLSFDVLPAARR